MCEFKTGEPCASEELVENTRGKKKTPVYSKAERLMDKNKLFI